MEAGKKNKETREEKAVVVIAGTYNGRENAQKVQKRLQAAGLEGFKMQAAGEYISLSKAVSGQEEARKLIEKAKAAGIILAL